MRGWERGSPGCFEFPGSGKTELRPSGGCGPLGRVAELGGGGEVGMNAWDILERRGEEV